MGKRYYCDYCDRRFIDDIQSRKKHINSIHHIKNRKLHYAACRDLTTLVEEESKKEQCKKFRNQGYCPFEESCTFTHYSKEELSKFANQVKNSQKVKILEQKLPSVKNWLEKRQKSRTSLSSCHAENNDNNFFQEYNTLLLPPSLQPVSIASIINTNFQCWG